MENLQILSFSKTKNCGVVTQFIEFNKKKFKLQYECTNGSNRLSVQIMNNDGEFSTVITTSEVGDKFEFKASYVSDSSKKLEDALRGLGVLQTMIEEIYS